MSDRIAALIQKIDGEIYKQQARNVAEQEKQKALKNWPNQYESLKEYAKRFPDRIAARHAVRDALACNRIKRPTICAVSDCTCKGPIQAHHWHGYDEAHWLDVQWLCRRHHRQIEKQA